MKAVRAWLDPIVAERERLVDVSATAPEADLLALDRKIVVLANDGEQRLKKLTGDAMGHAIAEVAFETIDAPDEVNPLFDTPPSVRAQKAKGDIVARTH